MIIKNILDWILAQVSKISLLKRHDLVPQPENGYSLASNGASITVR